MSEMKAIEKLRRSSHLDDDKWTLETGEVVHVFGNRPNDPNAVNWGEQWRKIADEIEAEIADRYMRLPVDSNNEPIHVGDKMEYENPNDDDKPFTVLGVNNDGDVFHCLEDKQLVPTCISLANCLHHVKPRTLEDVLNDLQYDTLTAQGEYAGEVIDAKEYHEELARLLNDANNEIRELLGGDAE